MTAEHREPTMNAEVKVATGIGLGAVLLLWSACGTQAPAPREVTNDTAALQSAPSQSTAQAAGAGNTVTPDPAPAATQNGNAMPTGSTGGAVMPTTTVGQAASEPRCLTDRDPPGGKAPEFPARDQSLRVSPAEKHDLKQKEIDRVSRIPAAAAAAAVAPTLTPERLRADAEYLRLSASVTDPDEQARLKRQILGE